MRIRLMRAIIPTSVEVFFDAADIIVSKTDLKGRITYANKTFATSPATPSPSYGHPTHPRHPDIRARFKLLWTHRSGRGVRLLNTSLGRTSTGFRPRHAVLEKQAHRRYLPTAASPTAASGERLIPLYAQILAEERRHANGKESLARGFQFMGDFVKSKGVSYDELVFSL